MRNANQGKPRSKKNPKHQIPNLKETPTSKPQTAPPAVREARTEIWSLVLGTSLELGAWCLELFLSGYFPLHPGSRVLGELTGVFQVELPFDLLAIILDGLDAQVQLVGNIARLFPLTDQLKNFQLPVAQSFDRRLVDIGLAADLLLQHFGSEAVTDINRAAEHAPDGG